MKKNKEEQDGISINIHEVIENVYKGNAHDISKETVDSWF